VLAVECLLGVRKERIVVLLYVDQEDVGTCGISEDDREETYLPNAKRSSLVQKYLLRLYCMQRDYCCEKKE
jgi:hypothetical protein